jgi:uncharacterized protein (TIGR02271 family)
MAKTVVGLMDTADEAQSVVQALVDSGFDRSAIGLMAGDQEDSSSRKTATRQGESEIGVGALKGAGTGAALGGIAGLVVGLAALPIPGIGPIIAAGPIAAALAGVGVGAAAGGAIGALTNMGVPENEAHYFAEGVRRGGTLVTVNAPDDEMAEEAAEIMRRHGAINIDERTAQWKATGWTGSTAHQETYTEGRAQVEDEQVLPVVKEELQVGKRQVERGGVRIYSHVTETPVEATVRLREEHLNIERRPVEQTGSIANEQAFKEQTFEVRETTEEPVIAKQAHVVEEVVIGKEVTEREENIRDTVRKTDVDIERLSGAAANDNISTMGEGIRASRGSSYAGPERRRNTKTYPGAERRMSH